MHYRWFTLILLVGLGLGLQAARPAIRALATVAVSWQVRWARDPDGVTTSAGHLARAALPTPPRTLQDLAVHLADLSGVAEGRPTPLELLQIGEQTYLILLAGTRVETRPFGYAGNNVESVLQQVTRQPSSYQQQVQAVITQDIPPGSTLHLVGHSLGGMVANSLATTPAILDTYTVASVTTFGTPVNACPHPDVAYHRYVVAGDPVPLVHQAAIWSRIPGPLTVLASTCPEGAAYVEQTVIDHSPGPHGLAHAHSSYAQSQDLRRAPLPFTIDRFESRGHFAAAPLRLWRATKDGEPW